MEKMPYRQELDTQVVPVSAEQLITTEWQRGLPVLTGESVTLRELRTSDAPSLFAMLTTEEVSRFISPPPSTVGGFERFIAWTLRQRTAGCYACFAVTLKGSDTAIGIFQIRETEPGFGTAEWGFAIGSPYWGTGIFKEGAQLVITFAFETIGVHRLEARAAGKKGGGKGGPKKMGAGPEGNLRKSLLPNGEEPQQVAGA